MITSSPGTSYAELNAILDQAQRRRATPPAVTEAQLLALQYRWANALAARLDYALETTAPGGEREAAANAWRRLAHDLPALRAVLDAHETHSTALAHALRGEYRMLALAAGLAGVNAPMEQALRVGRELRQRIWPAAASAGEPMLAHA